MAKRSKPRKATLPGLTTRNGRAYFHRRLPVAVGGDRLYKALECAFGSGQDVDRVSAVNVLWDRGDWPVLRRWQRGEIHVSEIVRAVREGAWERLRRVNADGYLLGRAVDEHLKRVEATSRGKTPEGHMTVCNALLRWFGADRPMQTISVAEAEGFLHHDHLGPGRPWAPGTQTQYKNTASALWQYVIDREAEQAERAQALPTLAVNPWRRAKVKKPGKVRPAVLTPEEIRDLLGHPEVRGRSRALFVALCGWAGLRLQEATHLRVATDLALDGPTPHLKIQARAGRDAWRPKTDRSERDVPITPTLVEMIESHLRRGLNGERYLLRGESMPDGPVREPTVRGWTRQAFEDAGIKYGRGGEGITPHGLRHSYATMLLSQGVSIAVVAELMGDTQEVVLATYSHALPQDRDRALKIIEQEARGPDDG